MERCPRRLTAECPRRLSSVGCRVVSHHIFWPKKDYIAEGPLATAFRELPSNKVLMCEQEEMELHRDTQAPPMPTAAVMRHCVEVQQLSRRLEV